MSLWQRVMAYEGPWKLGYWAGFGQSAGHVSLASIVVTKNHITYPL